MATRGAGIRVTQPGFSVPLAADYQFVFDSDWPSLAIAFETRVSVPFGQVITVPHNLGFFPLTMAWSIYGGVSIGRSFVISGNIFGPQIDVLVSFDKTNIYLDNTNGHPQSQNVTYIMSVKCYNLDISKAVDYTLPQFPTAKTKYDPSTGIKVTKFGKSMSSNDLRDYILHSRAQSPAVLSIVTKPTPYTIGIPYAIQYTNPVGYVPWVLAFISNNGLTYSPLAQGSQQAGFLFTTSAATATTGSVSALFSAFNPQTAIGSLVVLRDPLIVPNIVQVTY